jgi:transcriptional regulator with XRE-family HTH domain
MAVDIPAIREIVERVCTRPDVLDACKRHDLGFVIKVLCAHGVTQDQVAALTGKSQGRISEYMRHKRVPTDISIFVDFADGLGMPAAARRALGLTPEAAGSGPSDQAGGRSAEVAGASSRDVQPLLSNLSRACAVPVLSALREIHRGYVEADRLMGSICITSPIRLQMPVVERACEVTRQCRLA